MDIKDAIRRTAVSYPPCIKEYTLFFRKKSYKDIICLILLLWPFFGSSDFSLKPKMRKGSIEVKGAEIFICIPVLP